MFVLRVSKELSVNFCAKQTLMELTVATLASAMYRTQTGAMQSPGDVLANVDGGVSYFKSHFFNNVYNNFALFQVWNVTQFVKRVAGARTVAMCVIVRMGRVIPRMASVLVPGDLLDQNVKSPALKDITALTVYKSAPDVTQVR